MSFLMYETSWRDLGGPWLLNPDNRVGVNKSTCQKISLKRENNIENFRVLAGRRVSRQFEEFSPVLTLVF